jgi:hypothetical protein
MLTADASNDGRMLGHVIVERDHRMRLEDIRRYVCHGVLWEEDGWAREEAERTMRREEEEEDRNQGRGEVGGQWMSPMLGVIGRNLLLARSSGSRDRDCGGGNGEGGEHGPGARGLPTCGRKRQEELRQCQGKGRTIPVRCAGIRIVGGKQGQQ